MIADLSGQHEDKTRINFDKRYQAGHNLSNLINFIKFAQIYQA